MRADTNLPAGRIDERPVYGAAILGNVPAIRVLAAFRADLAIARRDGWSPIGAAVDINHMAAVITLANLGVDINARCSSRGKTPHEIALLAKNNDMVRLLTRLRANVDSNSSRG